MDTAEVGKEWLEMVIAADEEERFSSNQKTTAFHLPLSMIGISSSIT